MEGLLSKRLPRLVSIGEHFPKTVNKRDLGGKIKTADFTLFPLTLPYCINKLDKVFFPHPDLQITTSQFLELSPFLGCLSLVAQITRHSKNKF